MDALNEPAGARLDDGYIAGIVVDNAGRGDPRRQGADLRLDNPGAEILDGARVDLDACALGRALVGIFGNELHYHRREARPVIMFGRDYRIIPVENLAVGRSEEHTYELKSLMRTSYAVYCFKK